MILRILSILLLFSISVYGQSECFAELKIHTNSNESTIFIDSVFTGAGSIDTTLELGEYEIVVMESLEKWGGKVFTDTLVVAECNETYKLSYQFENEITLTSSPDDVEVIEADSILGYTPLRIKESIRNIELFKPGYEKQKLSLSPTEQIKKVSLKFIAKEESKPFTQTTLFKILIGSAAALGATAAYLKIEADEKFDKYLETRQSEFLDDTDRLDLYSGIAFGALQINFAALLYFFLIE